MKFHLALVSLLACLLTAADWPRFRGPNGVGKSDEAVPVDLSDKKLLRWSASVGEGNSSPVIAAGRLFVQASSSDGKERKLFCLDAATGKQHWTQNLAGHGTKTHAKNTLASSTPAVDDQRVVIVSWDGADLHLAAFALNGKPLWERNLGPFHSEHGSGQSPMLSDGRVFVANDQDGRAQIQAFDAQTGSPLWHADRKAYRASYSTPFLRDNHGRNELIVTSTAGVTAYDPTNGHVDWDHPWDWSNSREPLRTVGSSILADGLIFAYSGNGGGNSRIVALKPPNGSSENVNVAWERNKGFPYVPTLLSHGPHIFTVTDRGMAGCYEAKTAKEIWNERLGGSFAASPVMANGNIYSISEDGTLYVYKAAAKYELLSRHKLDEPVRATPAIADGRLYIRGKQTLYCFSEASK